MLAAVEAFGHMDILVANNAYSTSGTLEEGAAAQIAAHLQSVEPFHLFRYLDEEVFRFNMITGSVAGKRITYAELTKSYEAYYDEVMPKS